MTQAVTLQGPEQVQVYQALALRRAIQTYLKTGMKVNRAYTPGNMVATIARIVNKEYPKRATRKVMEQAAQDINKWIEDRYPPRPWQHAQQ